MFKDWPFKGAEETLLPPANEEEASEPFSPHSSARNPEDPTEDRPHGSGGRILGFIFVSLILLAVFVKVALVGYQVYEDPLGSVVFLIVLCVGYCLFQGWCPVLAGRRPQRWDITRES